LSRPLSVFSPGLLALGAGVLLAVGAGISACQPVEAPAAAESTPSVAPGPAVSPPLDVAAVMKQAGLAFRPAQGGFSTNQGTWQVHVDPRGTARFEALHWPESPSAGPARTSEALERVSTQVVTGAPLRVRTASISHGGRPLGEGLSVAVRKDGALALARGAVVEVLRNADEGLEQRWELESRPEGAGDLEVRVILSGLEYAGETEQGHHFVDPATRLGVRYGRATWVDAAGTRTAVTTVRDGGELVMRVPAAVLERASWPAVLDPVISPELGMDAPVPLPSNATIHSGVDVAFGGGVYLVTWTRYGGSATDYDVLAARVRASDGALLDVGSIAISVTAGFEGAPSVASNGSEFLVVWRKSSALLSVRVRASDGQVLDSTPKAVAPTPAAARSTSVVFDGTHYFVVWEDTRASTYDRFNSDIYGARVRASDGVSLDGTGIPLCTVVGDQTSPQVAFDGERFLAVWEDRRISIPRIYGARVRGSDMQVLDPGGRAISSTTSYQYFPSVAFDGVQFLAVWEDGRNNTTGANYDIFGARVRGTDGVVLDAAGIPIAVDVGADQTTAAVASNGRDSLVVWTHRTTSAGLDVYGARVGSDGTVSPSVNINAVVGASQQVPEIATDGTDYLVAWLDQRNSRSGIYAARVRGSDGGVVDPNGLMVSSDVNSQDAPSVALGGGTYLVTWGDLRNRDNGGFWDVYGGRVRAVDGVTLAETSTQLSMRTGDEQSPRVASDGRDFLVVWSHFTSNTTGYDVYGVRVRGSDGQVLGGSFLISDATGNQMEPSVAFGNGYYLVTWSDARNDAGDIYAARVRASDGTVMETRGVAVSRAANAQAAPDVAFGAGVFLVAWSDSRATTGVGTELYGARVRPSDGAVLDSVTEGRPLSQAAGNQTAPTLVFDGSQFLVAWADTRSGNSDLYGTRVRASDGVALDGAGRRLHVSAGDQGNPALTFDGRNHLLVWEETRSGVTYVRGARVTPVVDVLDAAGFDITVGTSPAASSWGPGHSLVVYSSKGNGVHPRVKMRRVLDLSNGARCAVDTACDSGFCADGVCCDSACGGGLQDDCQVCSVVAGGPVDGTCSPVPASAAKVCRAQVGPCDVAETCSGLSLDCPGDAVTPDGTVCDDGSACTQTDTCQSGTCAGAEPIVCTAPNPCMRPGECDPVSGTCSPPQPVEDGTACDDGNACTQSDTCQVGACTGASPVVCTAGDACHVAGTCDPSTGACSAPTPAPDGTACSDGNACTQTDACQAGTCTGTNPVECAAGDACHVAGTCDPATGACSAPPPAPDGTACSDGDACTQSDSCQAGTCTGANPVLCPAGDACHVAGMCNPSTGTCSAPTPVQDGTACDDGSACTQTDTCQSGTCTGASPVVCAAPNPCMRPGVCDPASGTCSPPQPVEDGTTCDDGNACTQSDSCQAGTCTGASPVVCTTGDACQVAGVCNPETGACSAPTPATDGTACSDGNACTQSDTCQAGACTGANPVECAAGDACHVAGTCDPATGACSAPQPAPDGTACSDGNACTQSDACQAGACTGTNPVLCTAGDACHVAGTCDPATGACSAPLPAPDGTGCNDGNACTQSDSCQAGTCTGANPVICPAGDACHVAGMCNPSTGTCTAPLPVQDGTACNDGNACTQLDSCQSGTCTGANPVVCSASDTCHAEGTCNPSTGTCSDPVLDDGTPCAGGTCQMGACAPTPDAGSGGEDAGTDAGSEQDAGGTEGDAGSEPDAGGTGGDAGADTDAGTEPDAGGTPDAGTDTDAGIEPDAGEPSDAGTRPPVSVPVPETLGCGCGAPAGGANLGLLLLIAGAALQRRARRQRP
jgi:hypothetical protein